MLVNLKLMCTRGKFKGYIYIYILFFKDLLVSVKAIFGGGKLSGMEKDDRNVEGRSTFPCLLGGLVGNSGRD